MRDLAFRPDFCISGHSIEYVDKYVHLGHVISSHLSDKEDIQRYRSNLVGRINNVICFFGELDVVTKMKFLISYSLYGCVIWNLTDPGIEQVCNAWRAGIRRVWVYLGQLIITSFHLYHVSHHCLMLLLNVSFPMFNGI